MFENTFNSFLRDSPTDAVSRLQFVNSSSSNQSSSDGAAELLLCASWDGTVRLYDPVSSKQLSLCTIGPPVLDASSLAPSVMKDDAAAAASNGSKFVCGDLVKRVLHVDFNKPAAISVLGHHEAPVRAVAVLPRENCIFSGGWDCKAKMFDTRSKSECQQICVPGKVFSMATSQQCSSQTGGASKSRLVICDSTKTVSIFDVRNLSQPESVRSQILKFQLRAVECFPNGSGFAVSSIEGRVGWEYFDSSGGSPLSAATTGTANKASGGTDGAEKQSYAFKCHRDKVDGSEHIYPVNAIAFHPVYGSFATGGNNGGVFTWDGYNKKRLWKIAKPFNMSVSSLSLSSSAAEPTLAVGLSPDSNIAAGSNSLVYVKQLKVEDLVKRQ